MDVDKWLIIAVSVIGLLALVGFFRTKKEGFGKFTTSVFLLLFTLIISGLFFAAGKIEGTLLGHLLFAIIGFAAGLFTGKDN